MTAHIVVVSRPDNQKTTRLLVGYSQDQLCKELFDWFVDTDAETPEGMPDLVYQIEPERTISLGFKRSMSVPRTAPVTVPDFIHEVHARRWRHIV